MSRTNRATSPSLESRREIHDCLEGMVLLDLAARGVVRGRQNYRAALLEAFPDEPDAIEIVLGKAFETARGSRVRRRSAAATIGWVAAAALCAAIGYRVLTQPRISTPAPASEFELAEAAARSESTWPDELRSLLDARLAETERALLAADATSRTTWTELTGTETPNRATRGASAESSARAPRGTVVPNGLRFRFRIDAATGPATVLVLPVGGGRRAKAVRIPFVAEAGQDYALASTEPLPPGPHRWSIVQGRTRLQGPTAFRIVADSVRDEALAFETTGDPRLDRFVQACRLLDRGLTLDALDVLRKRPSASPGSAVERQFLLLEATCHRRLGNVTAIERLRETVLREH